MKKESILAFGILEAACSGDPLYSKALEVVKQEFVVMESRLEQIYSVTEELTKSFQEEIHMLEEAIKLQ